MAKEYVMELLEVSLIHIIENIKDPLLRETEYTTGSHSLIAKDESYEKPKLNETAMKMAAYVDEVILKNMFEYDKQGFYTDWYTLIPLYCYCYAPIEVSSLPEHRIEPDRISDINKQLDLSNVKHRRQKAINQRTSEDLRSSNEKAYSEQPVVASLDNLVPRQVNLSGQGADTDVDPYMLKLFNYQIILKREKEVGYVRLPASMTREEAEHYVDTAGRILDEIDDQFLRASIHLNYLVED